MKVFDSMHYHDLGRLSHQESILVEENLGLVWEVMRPRRRIIEFCKSVYDEEDWFSIGVLALCAAAKGYDPSKGSKFTTYAGRTINNQFNMLKKYIDSRGLIREEGGDNLIGGSPEEGDVTFLDMVPDERVLTEDQIVLRVDVRRAYDRCLNDLEKRAVYMNVVEDKPLRLIEEETGIGRGGLHSAARRGLAKMREVLQ